MGDEREPQAAAAGRPTNPFAAHTLRGKVLRGGAWVFGLRISNRLLQLVNALILARLLGPEAFGLYGIAMLTRSILDTFTRTGLDQALVQKQGDVRPYLHTAWTVQVLRAVGLAALLYMSAPLAAGFFREPAAVQVLRAMAGVMILQGLRNIGPVFFSRELDFRRQFIMRFSGTVAEVIVGITAAFLLKNVWALVLALMARHGVRTLASFLIHPYRPRLSIGRDQFRELYGYGKWIFGNSALAFLATEGDDVLLGRLLGATSLGLYQMAFRLSNLVATEVTDVLSEVTFPAYAKLQSRVEQLRRGFIETLDVTLALSVPLAVGIWLLAPDAVLVVLGSNWLGMIDALRVLVVAGLLRTLSGAASALFRGTGRPQWSFWMNATRVAVLALTIWPFTQRYGMVGTAFSVVLALVATLPIWLRRAVDLLQVRPRNLMAPSASTFVATAVLSAVVWGLQRMLEPGSLLLLVVATVTGGAVYLGVQAALRPALREEVRRMLSATPPAC